MPYAAGRGSRGGFFSLGLVNRVKIVIRRLSRSRAIVEPASTYAVSLQVR